MGGCGFLAAVVVVVWSMGRWHETGSGWWLAAAIVLAVFTVAGSIHSLANRRK